MATAKWAEAAAEVGESASLGADVIPFRLRIGVTGHRSAQPTDELIAAIKEAIGDIENQLEIRQRAPVRYRVVSPLAEGADQIVAKQVLEVDGADLEVPLPLPPGPYLETFDSREAAAEFEALLGRARVKHVLTNGRVAAERAYQILGEWLVHNSDYLIAVWDEKPARGPGGTAEIVALASLRPDARGDQETEPSLPVVVINPEVARITRPSAPRSRQTLAQTYSEFVTFNTARIPEPQWTRAYEAARRELFGAQTTEREASAKMRLEEWMLARFVRADILAQRFQREDNLTANLTLLLAAAAVAVGAMVAVLWPRLTALKWLEVAMMGTVLLTFLGARLRQPHRRWLACRALAERLRVAPFLALVDGPAADHGGRLDKTILRRLAAHEMASWHERAFVEVWEQRPQIAATHEDLEWLKEYLVENWIEPQIAYHERSTRRNRDGFERLRIASVATFAITIVATLMHSLMSYDNVPAVLAIALPAAGGALSGIANNRQHQRQSKRYEQTARRLSSLRDEIRVADDIPAVRKAAHDALQAAATENDEWVELMRVHEAQLS